MATEDQDPLNRDLIAGLALTGEVLLHGADDVIGGAGIFEAFFEQYLGTSNPFVNNQHFVIKTTVNLVAAILGDSRLG